MTSSSPGRRRGAVGVRRRRDAVQAGRGRHDRSSPRPGMLEHYTVRDGDTLTGIASHFGVSMMTLWWANKITTKDSLHVGQDLVIPPVTGLVVTVKAGDTLDSIAAANKVDASDIVEVNGLTDSQPDRRPGARAARRQGRPAPDAQADREADQAAAGRLRRRRGRRRPGLQRRPLDLAGPRRRQLHQPVLPLRPLRDRHRGHVRDRRSSRRSPGPSSTRAGPTRAAATP